MGKFVFIIVVILSTIIVSCDCVQIRRINLVYVHGKSELNLWWNIPQEYEEISESSSSALLEITENHNVEIYDNVFTCFGGHIYIYKFFKQGENIFLETEYKSPYVETQTNKDSGKKKYQLEVSHIHKISHVIKIVYAYNDYIKKYGDPSYFRSTTTEQLNVIDYENENIAKETSFQVPFQFYFHHKINEIIALIEPI